MPRLSFKKLVEAEIKRARKSHKGSNSLHEGYGLMKEELEEVFELFARFWAETRKKPSKRNLKRMRHELAQVAALSEIIAEDNCS